MNFSYVMQGMAVAMAARRRRIMPPMPAGLYAVPSVVNLAGSTAWIHHRRLRRRLH